MKANAKLSDSWQGKSWIEQFRLIDDKLMAKMVLDSLNLISGNEFEQSLEKLIIDFRKVNIGVVALFPVKKKGEGANDSSGRIAHILKNIVRSNADGIFLEPDLKLMKVKKAKHIILVDDLIGSGNRLVQFWKSTERKTIKSWLSYGKCSLWALSYARYDKGETFIKDSISYLKKENFLSKIYSKESWSIEICNMLERYGRLTKANDASLGYSSVLCRDIFQHSCPNNAPSVLWSSGKNWMPIFPGRGIPSDLFRFFDENYRIPIPAISSANRIPIFKLVEELQSRGELQHQIARLLCLLGLLAQGYKLQTTFSVMPDGKEEIEALAGICVKYGFLESDFKMTDYGKDLIQRLRISGIKKDSEDLLVLKEDIYYPTQYLGARRKSSDSRLKQFPTES
jgi:hypothetical protein